MTNKISRAARERMARTGEPYTLARRMVIEEHVRLKARQVPLEAAPPATLTEAHARFLGALFGPQAPESSSGPPYTHVLRPPETDEEIAAAPYLPTLTITKDGE